MRPLLYLFIFLVMGWLPQPVFAAGSGALLQAVMDRAGRPMTTIDFRNTSENYLEMYFWSKDNFEVKEWPEYWLKLSAWLEELSAAQSIQKQSPLWAVTLSSYWLLCHDYTQARTFRAKGPKQGRDQFFTQMIDALLGEQIPSEPGVWRISLDSARRVVKDYPEDALAYVLLAEAILERQNIDEGANPELLTEAQSAITQALRIRPELDYAHFQQGQIYYLQDEHDKARTYFRQFVGPVDSVASEAVGNFYFWMKDTQGAVYFWEQARQESTDNQRLYQKLEQVYLQLDPQLVVKLYINGLQITPTSAFYYHKLQTLYPHVSERLIQDSLVEAHQEETYFYALIRGDLALQQEHKPEAVHWYQKALKRNPQEPQAYLNLLEILWEMGRFEDLQEILQQARANKIDPQELNYWQGVLAIEKKQLSEAIQLLKPLAQNNFRARYALMMAYRHKKDYAQAYKLLSSLMEQEPNNFSLLLTLGDMYLEQERFKDAEQAYSWAGKVEPYHEQVYFSLGNLYSRLNQSEQAMNFFQKAMLINPDALDIRNNLGNILIRQRRLDEALEVFQSILERNSNYASAYYNLACIHALKHENMIAFRYLETAFQLAPDLKKTAEQDSDLKNLRAEPQFQKLLN